MSGKLVSDDVYIDILEGESKRELARQIVKLENERNSFQSQLEAANRIIEVLEPVVKYYSDTENYIRATLYEKTSLRDDTGDIQYDDLTREITYLVAGKTARQALAEVEKIRNGEVV